jgi:hypothetical protein
VERIFERRPISSLLNDLGSLCCPAEGVNAGARLTTVHSRTFYFVGEGLVPSLVLKGRDLNSLVLQRQAGSPRLPIRPEGAVLFNDPEVGFRPFRADEDWGTLQPGAEAPGYSNCALSGRELSSLGWQPQERPPPIPEAPQGRHLTAGASNRQRPAGPAGLVDLGVPPPGATPGWINSAPRAGSPLGIPAPRSASRHLFVCLRAFLVCHGSRREAWRALFVSRRGRRKARSALFVIRRGLSWGIDCDREELSNSGKVSKRLTVLLLTSSLDLLRRGLLDDRPISCRAAGGPSRTPRNPARGRRRGLQTHGCPRRPLPPPAPVCPD